MCCSPKLTLASGRCGTSLKYSAIAAGVGLIVFAVVPQNTASGAYNEVMRAGIRLLNAAAHPAVAADTASFASLRAPPPEPAQDDRSATNRTVANVRIGSSLVMTSNFRVCRLHAQRR